MGRHRKPIAISLEDWFLKAYPPNKSSLEEIAEAYVAIEDLRDTINKLEESYVERKVYLESFDPDKLPERNGIDY